MRTQSTLNALVRELQSNCGDELAACRVVGVSVQFVRQWAKDDKDVADTLTEAVNVGTLGLVSAAIRRGVHGVEEDVYFKGAVVGQKINYSDSLLNKLLEAKVPEFAKKTDAAAPQVTVNVANLMPRAENYEQWLQMKQQTLAPPRPAEVVQDAEYSVIDDAQSTQFEPVHNPFAGVDL